MIDAMLHARDHITINMEMLKPGVSIHDLVHKGHQLADPELGAEILVQDARRGLV